MSMPASYAEEAASWAASFASSVFSAVASATALVFSVTASAVFSPAFFASSHTAALQSPAAAALSLKKALPLSGATISAGVSLRGSGCFAWSGAASLMVSVGLLSGCAALSIVL